MTTRDEPTPVEGEDFYREGALVVFTEGFHLRRGYCCGSGCRHCPYDPEERRAASFEDEKETVDASRRGF
ncbi:MAG TPA: DUF5522 domain-containing protein [Pyrinomonadaceae bacterium]|nr:DUF5522 domain-containing protein [Pyrinomonadaceae bacterium]